MKPYKIFLLIAIASAVFLVSCKKSFYTDVNVPPNFPVTVTPNLLLPTAEASLGYTQGGDLSRFTSLLTQQVFGANSQSQTYYNYGLNPGDFDNLWPDLYTSIMINDDTLRAQADVGGYNAYGGIARIIMAYTLQISVDTWGDIPYSQALKGNANLKPAYDDAQVLYGTIATLVDEGIVKLSDPNPGALIPGAEDLVYGGDADKWIKFGHAIKARLYLHQGKGNASTATKALAEIAQSFTGNDDNAQMNFGVAETAANPWYQFNRDRPGDESFASSTLAQNLKTANDPRYPVIIDEVNDLPGAFYGSVNSPVEFITYEELQFMSAEATLRTSGDYAVAQVFYQAGIRANMEKLGIAQDDIDAYITANGTLPTSSTDAAISKVASEEFIALYLNPEAFVLYRRTGSPDLVPVAGSQVPRRLLYPQTEYSYNAENTPASTLFTPKIFWDK